MIRIGSLFVFLLFVFVQCQNASKVETVELFKYPDTKRDSVVDNYFGTQVADPYRWLENDTSAETAAWVDAQNAVTNEYLSKITFRDSIKNKFEELFNYERYSAPFRRGKYYFFYKNDGLQNQSVLYVQEGSNGVPRVLLDPNKLSNDGTVSLSGLGVSKDGETVAYSVSVAGSDWNEIKTLQTATGTPLSDLVKWVKFSGISFKGNEGFYYSRYPEPTKGEELSASNKFHKIYFHKIGDSQANDELIYEDPTKPLRNYGASLTEDERFLIISASEGTSGNILLVKDLSVKGAKFVQLIDSFANDHEVVDNVGDKLIIYTNLNAPNYKLVLADPTKPNTSNWTDLIAESENVLSSVSTSGQKLFVKYMKDAQTKVYQYTEAGKLEHEIELPDLGTASGFGGYRTDTTVFYTFTSYIYPPVIFEYNILTGKSVLFKKSDVKFDPTQYESKQVFITSKDGEKVPLNIIHKKGIVLNGENPTLLYGYGGFNISLTPSFSISRVLWLDMGGVYAIANLRGGGEYGERWHKAGMLHNKQNVFNDFIASAEYLIAQKYTSSQKLAINGGSNGGLLVGACLTQRPDLFKVALPAVGVMDMLRFHKFTIGWAWAVEYGNADSSEADFKNLYAYSPLHNIKSGVEYPATLVTTADHDDRVVPAHSFKFIANLQANHKGKNPVMIRIEKKAGHGAGKPTSKIIEETADVYAFTLYNMGIDPFKAK